jgi:protein transport protein SEC23
LVESRFPHPLFIDCDQGSSQARFVLAILDPAITHSGQGQEIFSEDASLAVFMEHLKKLAVSQSS